MFLFVPAKRLGDKDQSRKRYLRRRVEVGDWLEIRRRVESPIGAYDHCGVRGSVPNPKLMIGGKRFVRIAVVR